MLGSLGGLSALVGCGSAGATNEVDVFAAASLTGAMTEIAADFESLYAGAEVRLNFAGSSTLREQLRDGADADVFIAANPTIMNELVADGLVDAGEVTDLGSNTLVVAVPVDNPGRVGEVGDLARGDLLVGVCAAGVPCGDLARDLLDRAGVAARIDTAAPDAAALAQRLRDGELDVALVYRSDVAAGALVEIPLAIEAPDTIYPMANLGSSEIADHFADYLAGPQGSRVLQRWGIGAP